MVLPKCYMKANHDHQIKTVRATYGDIHVGSIL